MSNIATRNNPPPRIALTPGEPAGIGPDLALLLDAKPDRARTICFADPEMLRNRARALGIKSEIVEVSNLIACDDLAAGVIPVYPVPAAVPAVAGELDRRNARYVLDCLDAAVDRCRTGDVDAMVTGPVQKSIINEAGIPFTGHTEYLADRLGASVPVMMLVAGALRVALVTTHLPLREVAARVSQQRLEAVLGVLRRDLKGKFGIAEPRLCVCGLNPHAGEGGHLGTEEIEVIRPVIQTLRERGWSITGPVAADTAFTISNRSGFDAIVAMYHDQGLAALKAVGFGDAVNVTLGLSVIRTSVDHGTALTLAGTGKADPGSLAAAIELAATLARTRIHDAAA
jgi:4-hydroxythreonine-4-phosphate dehydrogenase